MEALRERFSEYYDGDRRATVVHTKEGFEVDLYINDTLFAIRKVHDHSESYADDVAENWCQNFIKTTDLKKEELI